jgi:hypothetical protein
VVDLADVQGLGENMSFIECVNMHATLIEVSQNVAIAVVGYSFFRFIFGTKR